MNEQFYIEVSCPQIYCYKERICGDVFLSKKIREESRLIIVLSDGMGHGVKANILGTLTATFALNFTIEHKEINRTAKIIINTLPECSERKTGYATFSVVDIENDGKATILEYDNPQAIIIRDNKILEPEWQHQSFQSKRLGLKTVRTCSFYPHKEDRIIIMTDGVTQSGLGTKNFILGWGIDNVKKFALNILSTNKNISGNKLAQKIINEANKNDNFKSKDDISCGVIYFREPRKLILVSGPPVDEDKDEEISQILSEFEGAKIVCGATTGDIIARKWNVDIKEGTEITDIELPPISYIEGVDLYTEGVLTLSKVLKILSNIATNNQQLGKGPADQIVTLLLESDEIKFLIGTKINITNTDLNLPYELESRRTITKRISRVLEDKFLKDVKISFF